MPFKPPQVDRCGICEKAVYAQEKREAGDVKYHINCFKCHECKLPLTLQNYCQSEKILFCKKHYQDQVVRPNSQIVS